MAAHDAVAVQLVRLTFTPAAAAAAATPPAAFVDGACAQLRAEPGVAALHLGRPLERPDSWLLAVRWATPAALDAFAGPDPARPAPPLARWLAAVAAVADSYLVCRALLRSSAGGTSPAAPGPAVDAVLAAPCTEVFSAHGTADAYLDAGMRPFAEYVDAGRLAGYHASAFGPLDVLACAGVDPPEPKSVVMILGWDSKEAHMAHKGDDKYIDKCIHYVRENQKSLDMIHASLTKL